MGDNMLALVGGIGQGIAQGQQLAIEKEYKKAMIEHSKQQTKLLEAKLNLETSKQAMGPKLLEILTSEDQPQLGTIPQTIPTPGAAQQAPPLGGYGKMGGSKFNDAIIKASQQYGIDPGFLTSLIKNESGFNPQAISPKGAQGIMQFMPGTAARMGVQDPFDPNQAIPGGAKYIRQHLDEFGGDYRLAAAAYNAGEGAVRKHGGIPPYPETQKFVGNVMAGVSQTLGQEQMNQQLGKPLGKRSSGIDIKAMSFNKRVALDLLFKQNFDIDMKFRDDKTEVRGNNKDGFRIFNNGKEVGVIPGLGEYQLKETWNPSTQRTEYTQVHVPAVGGVSPGVGGAAGVGGPTGTGSLIAKPKPTEIIPDMPATAKEKLVGMGTFVKQLEMLQELGTDKSLFGTWNEQKYRLGRTWVGGLPGVNELIRSNPKLATFMQLYDTVHATRLFEMGGKQATVMELKTIMNTLATTKDYKTFQTQAQAAIQLAKQLQEEIKAGYRTSQDELLTSPRGPTEGMMTPSPKLKAFEKQAPARMKYIPGQGLVPVQ
jgi:hypothetical protein